MFFRRICVLGSFFITMQNSAYVKLHGVSQEFNPGVLLSLLLISDVFVKIRYCITFFLLISDQIELLFYLSFIYRNYTDLSNVNNSYFLRKIKWAVPNLYNLFVQKMLLR